MAVRVKIKIRTKKSNRIVESIALVNTGYETEDPEVMIPLRLAETLSIWSELPPNTEVVSYSTAGGTVKVYRVTGYAEVALKEVPEYTRCALVISEHEDEILLSDKLLTELGIVIEDPGKGVWRLKAEPSTRLRTSEKPQLW